MRLIQKLKMFEQAVVFLRWATNSNFGKILYVGEDFVEFSVLDVETMEYEEKFLINSSMILEVIISGYEISRIIAEMSIKVSNIDNLNQGFLN